MDRDGVKRTGTDRRELVDRCVDSIKTNLQNYKTGLASNTNIENMVASVTSNYLQKFAQDDSKNKPDSAMAVFIEKHQNFDIKEELQLV
jgi:hypothetical protein